MDNIEAVVLLLRKTSLTRDDIGSMSLIQFRKIVAEVCFQEAVEDYQTAQCVATILASIANTVPRKGGGSKKSSDFLVMSPPRRWGKNEPADDTVILKELAKRFNIKLPSREIKDIGG
uniref:Uncharacterized protein n=1 Tax=viral metagenome TaxID=1070528 RepID=A0A6M3KUC0_9ZZZZ